MVWFLSAVWAQFVDFLFFPEGVMVTTFTLEAWYAIFVLHGLVLFETFSLELIIVDFFHPFGDNPAAGVHPEEVDSDEADENEEAPAAEEQGLFHTVENVAPKEVPLQSLEDVQKVVRLSMQIHEAFGRGLLGEELGGFLTMLDNVGSPINTLERRVEVCREWFQKQPYAKHLLLLYPLNHLEGPDRCAFWETRERVVVGQDPHPCVDEGLDYNDSHFNQTVKESLTRVLQKREASVSATTLVLEARIIGCMTGINQEIDEISESHRDSGEALLLLCLLRMFEFIKGKKTTLPPVLVLSARAREMLHLTIDLDRMPIQTIAGTGMRAIVAFHPSLLENLRDSLLLRRDDKRPIAAGKKTKERYRALRLLSMCFVRACAIAAAGANDQGTHWSGLAEDFKLGLWGLAGFLPALKEVDAKVVGEDFCVDVRFQESVKDAYALANKASAQLRILSAQGQVMMPRKRKLILQGELLDLVRKARGNNAWNFHRFPTLLFRRALQYIFESNGDCKEDFQMRMKDLLLQKRKPAGASPDPDIHVRIPVARPKDAAGPGHAAEHALETKALTPNQRAMQCAVSCFEEITGQNGVKYRGMDVFPLVPPPTFRTRQTVEYVARWRPQGGIEHAVISSIQDAQSQIINAIPAVERMAFRAAKLKWSVGKSSARYALCYLSDTLDKVMHSRIVESEHLRRFSGANEVIQLPTKARNENLYLDPVESPKTLRDVLPKRNGYTIVICANKSGMVRLGWVKGNISPELDATREVEVRFSHSQWVKPWQVRSKIVSLLLVDTQSLLPLDLWMVVNSVLPLYTWKLRKIKKRTVDAAILPAASLLRLIPTLNDATLCRALGLSKATSLLPQHRKIQETNDVYSWCKKKKKKGKKKKRFTRNQWVAERLVSVREDGEKRLLVAKLPDITKVPQEIQQRLARQNWPLTTTTDPKKSKTPTNAPQPVHASTSNRFASNRFASFVEPDDDELEMEDKEKPIEKVREFNEGIMQAIEKKMKSTENKVKKKGNRVQSGAKRKGEKKKGGDNVTLTGKVKREFNSGEFNSGEDTDLREVRDVLGRTATEYTKAVQAGKELVLAAKSLIKLTRDNLHTVMNIETNSELVFPFDAFNRCTDLLRTIDEVANEKDLSYLTTVECFEQHSKLRGLLWPPSTCDNSGRGPNLQDAVQAWYREAIDKIRQCFSIENVLDFRFIARKLRQLVEKAALSTGGTLEMDTAESFLNDIWPVLHEHVALWYRTAFGGKLGKIPTSSNKVDFLIGELQTACKEIFGEEVVSSQEGEFDQAKNHLKAALSKLKPIREFVASSEPISQSAPVMTYHVLQSCLVEATVDLERYFPEVQGDQDTLVTDASLVWRRSTSELEIVCGKQRKALEIEPSMLNLVNIIATLTNPNDDEIVLVASRFKILPKVWLRLAGGIKSVKEVQSWKCDELKKMLEEALQTGWCSYVLPFAVKNDEYRSAHGFAGRSDEWFKGNNHGNKENSKNVAERVYSARLSAENFYDTDVPTSMATDDRRAILRDWNAASKMPDGGRRAYLYYEAQEERELALVDKEGKEINLEVSSEPRTLHVHGVKFLSRIDPKRNCRASGSRDSPRRYLSTLHLCRPITVNIPAKEQVDLTGVRVLFPDKVIAGGELKVAPKKRTGDIRLHISLRYKNPPPRREEPSLALQQDSCSSATVQKLSADQPFGLWNKTLRGIGHPNLPVYYQDLAADEEALRRIQQAQKQVFPEGYAGKYKNPAFADPGVKRMLSVYVPLEKRMYYLGQGAAARLFNTVEKQRRKAQSYGLPQDRFLRKAAKIKDNLHESVVDFIIAAFDLFVLPKPIKGAGLGGDNKWMIQHLAFGRFEELLKRKASRQGGIDLLLRVSEACTTMSCGGCGRPNHDIGNKEVHVCRYCNTKQARDGGAPRNLAFLCSVDEPVTTPTSGTKRERDQQATTPTDPKRQKHEETERRQEPAMSFKRKREEEKGQEQPATTPGSRPENKTTNKEVGGSGNANNSAPSSHAFFEKYLKKGSKNGFAPTVKSENECIRPHLENLWMYPSIVDPWNCKAATPAYQAVKSKSNPPACKF